jgi:hypothetical protein
MQEIIIVAGPNGAGKTSFANKHFDTPRPGLVYLETLYKSIVDEWYIWDSLEGEFRWAEAWND